MTMKKIAIIGAGFSGAVIARELATKGFQIDIFDARSHVAGNCHTQRDERTGVMEHIYGPHIFHTNNERVWYYVNEFDEFVPYINRVKSIYKGNVYSLPINLMTINTFFGKAMSPKEAEVFMKSVGDTSIDEAVTFEEQALKFVGLDLYEAFFKGYTSKQWGVHPKELPASILKRLPIRFNYDDNYYSSKFQGIPRNGYTYVVQKILSHPNIDIHLDRKITPKDLEGYEHVFNSSPIDAWYEYSLGRLGYRTLDFKKETHQGDYQGNAVINYGDENIPWTRISEHKHFTPWESHDQTVIYKEYSRLCENSDIPYYPLRLVNEKNMLAEYVKLAQKEKKMTFIGRLGTYRYLDMHVTIAEAFDASEQFIELKKTNQSIPVFFSNPLN